MAGGFQTFAATARFERDLKRLDAVQRAAVAACIDDMKLVVIPAVRRFHCVSNKRPKVYSLDVFPNKSHKLTVELQGTHVVLRRVGTHKEIDDAP